MRTVGVLAVLAFGCLKPHSKACSDGRVCPEASECNDVLHLCVLAGQIEVCDGKVTGDSCTFFGQMGVCDEGACVFELDTDRDQLPDESDNCPAVANPSQSDFDRDGVGDVCDSCPIAPNTAQDDFDGDGVGDECDPRPALAGECIVLFDQFDDPTTFDQQWLVTTQGAATVVASKNAVTMSADGAGGIAAILARGSDGNLLEGDLHVSVAGTLTTTGSGYAIGNADPALDSYTYCNGRYRPEDHTYLAFLGWTPGISGLGFNMSSPPLGEAIAMRLDKRPGDELFCRVDWGIAVGTIFNAPITPVPGASGALVTDGTLTVSAVVLYESLPSGTCPVPLIR